MITNASSTIRERSSLRQYLTEIGETPLLTAQEEVKLATRIQKDGDEAARQQMMRANLRLVVNIAKQYSTSYDPDALLDLIQEGNIGLMRAVDRFDPEFKTRFSTYGVYWIRQAILRALKSRRLVRLPENVVDRVLQMQRMRQSLYQTLGRWPTPEELASELKLSAVALRQLESASTDVLSLHQPVRSKDGDGETQLQELLEDTEALSPNQVTQRELVRDEIREAVATLPPREKKILDLRFGLTDERPHTLDEIGREFGISRERVRQLQNVALVRLRQRRGVQQIAGE